MAVAIAHTVALRGAVGHLIDVQADVSPGQVGLTLVGRADAAAAEGRDRVRMAVINSDLEWPSTKRVTVLLSPADLPKTGTHFDLALAVAILAASGVIAPPALTGIAFAGELGLDGGLRPVAGVLPMVIAAAERGLHTVVVPEPQATEAAMVPDMTVLGIRSLAQVVALLRDEEVPEAPPVPDPSAARLLGRGSEARLAEVDFADLEGIAEARYAAEVAAAGGHHLLLDGPKGCGKTSLAERIPGLLPPLSTSAAVELAAVRSLAGVLDPVGGLSRAAPFCAPHHDASKASIIGGGNGRVRPGQVSLATGGVLLLDEFALFRTDVIDALREPMESGDITVARGDEVVTLPAHCLIVLATNPCPCGNFGVRETKAICRCSSKARQDYQRRISGPVVDRIDIVRRLGAWQPYRHEERAEPSEVVRARVVAARERQAARYAGRSWDLNAHVPGPALRDDFPLTPAAQRVVEQRLCAGELSRRGAVRVQRLAWTIADLAGREQPDVVDAEAAMALRLGGSLQLSVTERRSA